MAENVESGQTELAIDDAMGFDDMNEKDHILIEQINDIDRRLEENLADLDHSEERGKLWRRRSGTLLKKENALIEKKRKLLYGKVSSSSILIYSAENI